MPRDDSRTGSSEPSSRIAVAREEDSSTTSDTTWKGGPERATGMRWGPSTTYTPSSSKTRCDFR